MCHRHVCVVLSQESSSETGQASVKKRGAGGTQSPHPENNVVPDGATAPVTPTPVPTKPRRGRPPKSLAAGGATSAGGAGRGRKRAAPTPDNVGSPTVEPITIKIPKQQEVDGKRATTQRQMDLQR